MRRRRERISVCFFMAAGLWFLLFFELLHKILYFLVFGLKCSRHPPNLQATRPITAVVVVFSIEVTSSVGVTGLRRTKPMATGRSHTDTCACGQGFSQQGVRGQRRQFTPTHMRLRAGVLPTGSQRAAQATHTPYLTINCCRNTSPGSTGVVVLFGT